MLLLRGIRQAYVEGVDECTAQVWQFESLL